MGVAKIACRDGLGMGTAGVATPSPPEGVAIDNKLYGVATSDYYSTSWQCDET